MKKLKLLIPSDCYDGVSKQKESYLKFFRNLSYLLSVDIKVRVLMPDEFKPSMVNFYDGVIMPGGSDVNPVRYNEPPHVMTQRANVHYEYFDTNIVPLFIDANKIVIGICRGMQSLNVIFGGNLIQHIDGHNKSYHYLHPTRELIELFSKLHHTYFRSKVIVADVIETSQSYENKLIKSNSYHHQCVGNLGDNLIPIVYSEFTRNVNNLSQMRKYKTDRVIEAFIHESKPIVAFQYHPEEDEYKSSNFSVDLIGIIINNYFNNIKIEKNKNLLQENA